MARSNLKSFANPDVLKRIDTANLMELFAPYQGYLEARGFGFPPAPGGEPDYRRLALILIDSDEETPAEFIDALHIIGNVGVDERIDDLLQIAFLNGVDTGDGGITAADLVVRIWLKAPKALEKLVRDELFEKKRRFEHFPARETGVGISPESLPEDLEALEGSLDQWFVAKKRGAGCVIDRAVAGSEARFLVAHGMPCKRERNRKGRESSPLYFRPEKTDLVIYDAATNELRVHAGTLGELRLYVSAFGHHLFGDPEQFVYTAKYTLEPLKELGRDALRCRDVEGVESIRLREIRYLWPGAFEHVETHKAFDLFLAFEMRRMGIHPEPKITKAVFGVKLQGLEKPRKVSICPPNVAEYGHGDEAALI